MRAPRSKSRATWLAGMAVLSCLAVSACSGGSGAADGADGKVPIKIGLPSSNYWPAYVARDQGLYEEAGFDAQFVSFTTGAPMIAALESGSIDAVFTGLATLFALQQGVELTYLYTPLDSSSQEGMVVDPASGITSFEDLDKANSIAAPTATCSQIAMVMAADAAGIDFRSLPTANVAPNLLQTSFEQNQIDATFIWGPWNLQLEEAGYDIVSWDEDYQPDGGVCATNVAARPAYLEENPSAACRLVMAHDLALDAARENPDLGPQSLVKELGLSPEIAQKTYDTLEIPPLESQLEEDNPWSLTGDSRGLSTKLHLASDALQRAGVFPQAMSQAEIAEHIDVEPLRQYLEAGSCE